MGGGGRRDLRSPGESPCRCRLYSPSGRSLCSSPSPLQNQHQNSITSYGPREAPEGNAFLSGKASFPCRAPGAGLESWVRIGMSWRAGATRPLVKATELGKIRRERGRRHSWETQGRWLREVMVWARRGPQESLNCSENDTGLCTFPGEGGQSYQQILTGTHKAQQPENQRLQSRGPATHGQEAEHFYIFKRLK